MKITMASLSASPRMLLFSLFALRGTDVLASLECPNCRYELCAPNEHGESRHCLYGCKPGYYGRQCLNNCTKRECELNLDCNRHPLLVNEKDKYDCAVCPAGYYRGNTWETFNCTLKCPFNCKSCSAINDCHECKGSFYNEGIIRTCSIKCPRNCLTCLSPSLCKSCQSPYYNHGSVTNCSLSSCEHGLYGEHCTEACSSQCVNLVCDRLSGDCLFGKREFVNSEKKFLSDSSAEEDGLKETALTILGTFVPTVLLTSVVIIFTIRVRKRQKTNMKKTGRGVEDTEMTTGGKSTYEELGPIQVQDVDRKSVV